jgi:hypothetical protein
MTDSYREQLAAELALENTYRSRIEPGDTAELRMALERLRSVYPIGPNTPYDEVNALLKALLAAQPSRGVSDTTVEDRTSMASAPEILKAHNYFYQDPYGDMKKGFYYCLCGWEGPDRSSYWKHLPAIAEDQNSATLVEKKAVQPAGERERLREALIDSANHIHSSHSTLGALSQCASVICKRNVAALAAPTSTGEGK